MSGGKNDDKELLACEGGRLGVTRDHTMFQKTCYVSYSLQAADSRRLSPTRASRSRGS